MVLVSFHFNFYHKFLHYMSNVNVMNSYTLYTIQNTSNILFRI